ncbi:predicted protein [Histoplasma capsulatum H143]|uniref:Uncharacterized protein n=1 Tax=Ajellomyces capsulatus (strain H143) TaxID=544712 RepID=C6H8D5_AJECH|nr:predicted protein [Histoplasma capsulatum H143]
MDATPILAPSPTRFQQSLLQLEGNSRHPSVPSPQSPQLHDRKCDHWLRGRFAGVYIQSLRRIASPPPSTLGEARACTTAVTRLFAFAARPRTGQIYAPTPSCIKQASYHLHARPPSIVQREESGTQGRSTLFGFGWKVIFLFHS